MTKLVVLDSGQRREGRWGDGASREREAPPWWSSARGAAGVATQRATLAALEGVAVGRRWRRAGASRSRWSLEGEGGAPVVVADERGCRGGGAKGDELVRIWRLRSEDWGHGVAGYGVAAAAAAEETLAFSG